MTKNERKESVNRHDSMMLMINLLVDPPAVLIRPMSGVSWRLLLLGKVRARRLLTEQHVN